MTDKRRNGHVYRRTSKAARETPGPDGVVRCWLCGKPIDLRLRHPHPMSAAADHATPLATGGAVLGPRKPAHKVCNESRGAKPPGDYHKDADTGKRAPLHSQDW